MLLSSKLCGIFSSVLYNGNLFGFKFTELCTFLVLIVAGFAVLDVIYLYPRTSELERYMVDLTGTW